MDTPKATRRAQHDRSAPQIEMRSPASLKPNPRHQDGMMAAAIWRAGSGDSK